MASVGIGDQKQRRSFVVYLPQKEMKLFGQEIIFLCVITTQIEFHDQTVPFNVRISRTSFSHFVEGKLRWAHLDIKAIYRIMSCTAVRGLAFSRHEMTMKSVFGTFMLTNLM